MRRILTPVLVAALTATLLPTAASAQTPTAPALEIKQGTHFRTSDGLNCTIGFVEGGRAYTAAHCVKDESTSVNVYLEDGSVRNGVGRITLPTNFKDKTDSTTYTNDYTTINWLGNVTIVDDNPYSGNTKADVSTLTKQDDICFYGYTTNKVTCGKFVGTVNKTVLFDAVTKPGDSGGPVWAKDKGFIGVVSAQHDRDDCESISQAAMLEDGETVTNAQILETWEAYKPYDASKKGTCNESPTPPAPAPKDNEGSSTVGIVLGVIAGIAAIGGIAFFVAQQMGFKF